MPFLVITTSAKSPADFYTSQQAMMQKFGDQVKDLNERSMKILRKVEQVNTYYRPDLSYMPQEQLTH